MIPAGRVGIVLLQLGTPAAATPAALRTYLREFLLDRRVVDAPRAVWWPVLFGIVLTTRPARSARLYQRVWTEEGSPLLVTSRAQAAGLAARLGTGVSVAVAMRYGKPSIDEAVDRLLADGCDRLLAFPMYPQYAGATTGSSLERLYASLGRRRVVLPVRVVPPYFADAAYIDALAAAVREDLGDWTPDQIVMSFHGLPKRYAEEGDPYPTHCRATADALAAALDLPGDRWMMTFQSRFGREEWLQPYTDGFLRSLAGKRVPRVAVVCPGFTADCLETIEEIGITGQERYHAAGGGEYRTLRCVNTRPVWLDAMAAIARRELTGWE